MSDVYSPDGYLVIHERTHPSGDVVHQAAGSIWPDREPVENHLAYCLGMQKAGRRGTEGRYFIAAVREVKPADG